MTNVSQLAPPTYRQGISSEALGAGDLDGPTTTLVDVLERRVQSDAAYCAYKYVSDDGSVSTLTIGQLGCVLVPSRPCFWRSAIRATGYYWCIRRDWNS